jgi:hypothetical protein
MGEDSRLSAIEARLRALEDEGAVLRTIVSYGLAFDGRDVTRTAELFTEDCVYDADAYSVMRGRSEVADMAADPTTPRTAHCIGPSVVEIDGDRAVATGYSTTFHLVDDRPALSRLSFNRWELTRSGSSWLIRRRTTRLLGSQEAAELFRRADGRLSGDHA